MSSGGFLGAARPLEIFGESVIVTKEELAFVVDVAWSKICSA